VAGTTGCRRSEIVDQEEQRLFVRVAWSLERKGFFDLGGEFESERVEALGKIADVLKEMIVGDQRGDGGEEAGGGGDQSFSDTGRDGAKAGGTSRAEAGESVNDAPHGTEETDKRSDAGGGGEPGHALFDATYFVGGSELHADGDGLKRFDFRVRIVAFTGNLGLEFAIAGGVNVGEGRASGDDALRIGNPFGSAEDSQELIGLTANAAEDAEFLKDERPRDQREKEKEQEDCAGHEASLLEDVKDVADHSGE